MVDALLRRLNGADDGRPVFAFEVMRHGRGPLHVLWADGDVFSGEDQPPAPVDWPWPHPTAQAVDVFKKLYRQVKTSYELQIPADG